MYIIKNALRSIARAKGRNLLIGIIILVIAASSCVALSIRQASGKTKETALENMEITAQISVDRTAALGDIDPENPPDRDQMRGALEGLENLTVEEMQAYAKASTVKDFYYTLTSSADAGEGLEPVDTSGTSDGTSSESSGDSAGGAQGMPGGGRMGGGRFGLQGDFTVVGYSSDSAMTEFAGGTHTITEGAMFGEGTAEKTCVVSDELALYNSLEVGDSITLVNPNKDTETFALKIAGIYNNSASSQTQSGFMGGFSAAADPANRIYMSYNALRGVLDTSAANASTETDEETGRTTSDALAGQEAGTYVFANAADYEAFEDEVRDMGLADTYAVSSADVESFEQSLQPLESLSKYALYFLVIVLGIGGVILTVLNIFSIRERKYEIGVLAAIGMKKPKVSLQFVTELFAVTFAAVIAGTAVGAAAALPITNALLEGQVAAQTESVQNRQESFGRTPGGAQISAPGGSGGGGGFRGFFSGTQEYVTKVSSATDFTVVAQLMFVGILLTVLSSAAAIISVLRYDPLKILTMRD